MHEGIDIGAGYGSSVVAAAGGTVIAAGWDGGYGKCVQISHGGGTVTRYAHLSSINVSAGQRVDRGQLIGLVGSTGNSTGPHLHFEVIIGGQPRNPVNYLP
jgi:murein DD-endopeptidase MepM/ murein hydrolase activator NlpD